MTSIAFSVITEHNKETKTKFKDVCFFREDINDLGGLKMEEVEIITVKVL